MEQSSKSGRASRRRALVESVYNRLRVGDEVLDRYGTRYRITCATDGAPCVWAKETETNYYAGWSRPMTRLDISEVVKVADQPLEVSGDVEPAHTE